MKRRYLRDTIHKRFAESRSDSTLRILCHDLVAIIAIRPKVSNKAIHASSFNEKGIRCKQTVIGLETELHAMDAIQTP